VRNHIAASPRFAQGFSHRAERVGIPLWGRRRGGWGGIGGSAPGCLKEQEILGEIHKRGEATYLSAHNWVGLSLGSFGDGGGVDRGEFRSG